MVPEAMHEASRGPLKGAVSAQKALQGSETETRELLGGTAENSVSLMRGRLPFRQINDFFTHLALQYLIAFDPPVSTYRYDYKPNTKGKKTLCFPISLLLNV